MLWLCLIESMPNQKRNTSAEYTTRRLFTGLDCNKFYYICHLEYCILFQSKRLRGKKRC